LSVINIIGLILINDTDSNFCELNHLGPHLMTIYL
jgi:hypothetical protein